MQDRRSEYIKLIKSKKFFKCRKKDILEIYNNTTHHNNVKKLAIHLLGLLIQWFYKLKKNPNFDKWNNSTWYNMMEISKCFSLPIEITQIASLLTLKYTVWKMKSRDGRVNKEVFRRLKESEENTNFILNNLVVELHTKQ